LNILFSSCITGGAHNVHVIDGATCDLVCSRAFHDIFEHEALDSNWRLCDTAHTKMPLGCLVSLAKKMVLGTRRCACNHVIMGELVVIQPPVQVCIQAPDLSPARSCVSIAGWLASLAWIRELRIPRAIMGEHV